MSIDVSHLTPAPWSVEEQSEAWFSKTNHAYRVVSEGKPTYYIASIEGMGKVSCTDAQFIALARNAYEVMMRRGWYPVNLGNGKWNVFSAGLFAKFSFNHAEGWKKLIFDDPFTALIESDRWYKEHVES